MSKEAISRRAVVATAALVPLSTVKAFAAAAASVFSAVQQRTLEAFVDRLVPRDEYGPSASECGVVKYIDQSLAGFLSAEKSWFLDGLKAVDTYARGAHGKAFADLSTDQQDAALTTLENNRDAFFDRVRRLTLEGMMSDPYYGGNANYAGWDLIRYPGPRLAVSEQEQILKDAIKPVRASAYGGGHRH
jgi:gluconate 2-dehydrogenase gamma chain